MTEYIVNNPVSIKVINTDGKILRSPQEIRERIVRCRDCKHGDGLQIIRTAMVQPVGATDAAARVKGAVTDREYDRAVMQVICAAMQLWASGKLGEVVCDG